MALNWERPISSTSVREYAYDEDTGELHVRFHNGTVYKYNGLTPDDYDNFRNSPSKGSHVHNMARKHKYVKV
ncbi:KTSC domain-containing protein [Patescibacteria group bacterium]|nr:KTSC domain-containing protein [Patescibacteria group bacterium]